MSTTFSEKGWKGVTCQLHVVELVFEVSITKCKQHTDMCQHSQVNGFHS